MKQAEVVISGVYLTRVSGEFVPVRVVRETQVRVGAYDAHKSMTAFVLERVEPGRPYGQPSYRWLPKPRKAASLRHTKRSAFAVRVVAPMVAALARVSS